MHQHHAALSRRLRGQPVGHGLAWRNGWRQQNTINATHLGPPGTPPPATGGRAAPGRLRLVMCISTNCSAITRPGNSQRHQRPQHGVPPGEWGHCHTSQAAMASRAQKKDSLPAGNHGGGANVVMTSRIVRSDHRPATVPRRIQNRPRPMDAAQTIRDCIADVTALRLHRTKATRRWGSGGGQRQATAGARFGHLRRPDGVAHVRARQHALLSGRAVQPRRLHRPRPAVRPHRGHAADHVPQPGGAHRRGPGRAACADRGTGPGHGPRLAGAPWADAPTTPPAMWRPGGRWANAMRASSSCSACWPWAPTWRASRACPACA
jgi:hypothetical protein